MTDQLSMDVNQQDSSGETPLALACATARYEVAKLLLSKGASPTLRSEPLGTSPLHRAANAPTPDLIDLLIDSGADVSVASKTGTPLCWAAGAGLPENVTKLVARGAPLIPPSVQLGEAQQGAKGEGEAGRGKPPTPLVHAAACGCERSVQILIAAGSLQLEKATAKIKDEETRGSTTALHAVAAVSNQDPQKSVRIATLLLEGGADPDAFDEGGLTPLLIAAIRDQRPLVELLLPLTDKSRASLAIGEIEDWGPESVIKAARSKYVKSVPSESSLSQSKGGEGSESKGGEGQSKGGEGQSKGGEGAASVGALFSPPEPEDPNAQLAAECKRKGDEAFVKRDFSTSVFHYSESLSHETSNPAVWANRSMAYLKLKEPPRALHDARIARCIDPKYMKAWYREGSAYLEMKLWEDAALAFFQASQIDPSNMDVTRAFQDAIANGKREHLEKSNKA